MINTDLTSTIQEDATRYLSAGVYFDRPFRNKVIRKVHNDTAHRTAPSYGFDLITVVRTAWQAWIFESLQLTAVAAALLVTLAMDTHAMVVAACAIGIIYLLWVSARAAPETLRLHAQAAGERVLRRRGIVDHGRRRERSRLMLLCLGGCGVLAVIAGWAAGTTPDPSRQLGAAAFLLAVLVAIAAGAGIARQVALNHIRWRPPSQPENPRGRLGIIKTQQESPYVVYRRPFNAKASDKDNDLLDDLDFDFELTPFVGSGILVHRWLPPLNIQLMRPGEGSLAAREYQTAPFHAHEVVAHLKEAMSVVGEEPSPMLGFRIEDRLFIAETDLPPFRPFLRGSRPPEDIDAVIDEPNGRTQHFLEIQLTASGEVVTTAFVRVSVRGRSLSLDFAACALTRLPSDYQLLDAWRETGTGAIIRSALRQVCALPVTVGTLWRLGEVPWFLARAIRAMTTDRTLYPRRRSSIASRFSIREETAADWGKAGQDKTAIFDDVKIIESRLLEATKDFLKSRDVDISVLESRAMAIINTGILNMGGHLSMNNTTANVGNNANVNVGDTQDGSAPAK